MLAHILLLALVVQINCTSICDRHACVCWVKNVEDTDFVGENVQCSYVDPDILKTNYTLPDIMKSLDLSSNKITEVHATSLFQSSTLSELLLKNNAISKVNVDSFQLPELTKLDLSENLLEFIDQETFRNVKKLKYLNLANNRFTAFTKLNFHHLSNLNEIILDNNNIGLSLKRSNLFNRSGAGVTNKIQSVSISGIGLNTVPDNFFIDAYDLRRLVISNNSIQTVFEIPFTLQYLDLSDNPITYIANEDFAELVGLQVLILNNLQIKEVQDFVFEGLHSLKTLSLERNGALTEFSKYAFGRDVLVDPDVFQLERLSLKGSRLARMDEELALPFGELIELDLQGNPWLCDCHIVWVKTLQISKQYSNHLRCAEPSPLYNARIFELKNKYLTCDNHQVGFIVGVVSLCATLAIVALWVFLCLPKRHASCSFMKNMYGPSTAYSILPMTANYHNGNDR